MTVWGHWWRWKINRLLQKNDATQSATVAAWTLAVIGLYQKSGVEWWSSKFRNGIDKLASRQRRQVSGLIITPKICVSGFPLSWRLAVKSKLLCGHTHCDAILTKVSMAQREKKINFVSLAFVPLFVTSSMQSYRDRRITDAVARPCDEASACNRSSPVWRR